MARWLIERRIHVFVTPVPLEQKGFAYELKSYAIQTWVTQKKNVKEILEGVSQKIKCVKE